jgi:hypothetical protein
MVLIAFISFSVDIGFNRLREKWAVPFELREGQQQQDKVNDLFPASLTAAAEEQSELDRELQKLVSEQLYEEFPFILFESHLLLGIGNHFGKLYDKYDCCENSKKIF